MESKNILFDDLIDSYWNFIDEHKLDDVNLKQPFINYVEGKLIIDLKDLNACNVHNQKNNFIDLMNLISKQRPGE